MVRLAEVRDYCPHMPTSQDQSAPAGAAPHASANQLDTKAQAWSALFSEPMSDLVKRYTSSVFFDKRLCRPTLQAAWPTQRCWPRKA